MPRTIPPPCVLTIAGSDSGGGAGVQADARTIHALGGFACMAITAVTAQNTRGVSRWEPVAPRMIAAQIEAVLGAGERGRPLPALLAPGGSHGDRGGGNRPVSPGRGGPAGARRSKALGAGGSARLHRRADQPNESEAGALPVRAIKTGLIPGAAAVRAIAQTLRGHPGVPLVIDPVIGSTSGTRFLDRSGVKALQRELLPIATLVTPNWPEAEVLSGFVIRSFTDAERAALAIAREAGCAVLVKGGHASGGGPCRDCLARPDGSVRWYECARIETPNTHGTGCVLSAAIATALARGEPLDVAVATARRFLQRALGRDRRVSWNGAGPAFAGR